MSRTILSLSLLALIAAGCNNDNQNKQQAYLQSTEQAKPVVSIVPIIDNTENEYTWSLSDELSSSIYNRIADKNKIAINKLSQVRSKLKHMNAGQNPFGTDLAWTKNVFKGDQFAVFMELVEHEEVPRRDRKSPAADDNCSADLNMSVRVRVVDLRGDEPKIVLQELVRDSQYVPRPFTQHNFFQISWKEEGYGISPLGIAHASLTKEISKRIEDYIVRSSEE